MSTTTITQTQTTTSTSPDVQIPIPRGPVTTELTFYAPPADNSTPYNYVEPQPSGIPQRNYLEETHSVTLSDIRGRENEYTLDKDAFQVLRGVESETVYETFNDEEAVERIYYPEVEKLILENVPGSHKVVIFDHTIRRESKDSPRGPVNRAHVDQTAKAAAERVNLHVSDKDEAERLLQGRYRIINVWRPLNGAVISSPLAFASASSISPSDLVPIEHRYPHRTGETMGVRYNPGQEWKYLSGMENEERLLLKCADSKGGEGIGERVPHSAFADPRTEGSEGKVKGRESIEVRALVFG